MSWEIFDKTEFVSDCATYNLKLLTDLKRPAIIQFINSANSREGASAAQIEAFIKELRDHPDWQWLVKILREATPPVRLINGDESWLRDVYPNEDWDSEDEPPDGPEFNYFDHNASQLYLPRNRPRSA